MLEQSLRAACRSPDVRSLLNDVLVKLRQHLQNECCTLPLGEELSRTQGAHQILLDLHNLIITAR